MCGVKHSIIWCIIGVFIQSVIFDVKFSECITKNKREKKEIQGKVIRVHSVCYILYK